MSDAFPWLVATLVAAVLVAAVGLRAVIRRGPGFGIGTVLLTVGICVSDAARFWMHDPVGAVVLSAVASLGLGLFVHALFRSWLEILCEAWLLGAGAALSLHFALMLLGSPSQSLATNLDLVLLATSLFTSATLVRLRSELFPHRGFLAPAVMVSLNARDLMWLLGFLGSALGVPALGTAALVAQGSATWPSPASPSPTGARAGRRCTSGASTSEPAPPTPWPCWSSSWRSPRASWIRRCCVPPCWPSGAPS